MEMMRALFIISFIASFLFSCTDIRKGDCVQEFWIGDFNGIKSCDNDSSYNLPMTIVVNGADVIIMYGEDGDKTYPLIVNNCEADYTTTQGDYSINVKAYLEGDKLFISETETFGDSIVVCSIDATKQE